MRTNFILESLKYLIYPFYRGSCTSRDKIPEIAGAPPEEDYTYKSECRIKLNEVDFETY